MVTVTHYEKNPILSPDPRHPWENLATYNGSVTKVGETYHMFYRAQGKPREHIGGVNLSLSTIGHATSSDGLNFSNREQLLRPDYDFEKFGLEDPRATVIENKIVIFYTALSQYPFNADGIKVGVAISEDLKTFTKYPVTPFNSKAMTLFPERIKGKLAAILTVDPDRKPPKICLALFDNLEDIWSKNYWENWQKNIAENILPFEYGELDHIEIGASPLKTDKGWLLVYSYIKNYLTDYKQFGIEAAILDESDPFTLIGKTHAPLLTPEKEYELNGYVPNVIFPSSAMIEKDLLRIYYGAADTHIAVASLSLSELFEEIELHESINIKINIGEGFRLNRFSENPILVPLPFHDWESEATFNAAALYTKEKVHILYRAMGQDQTSVMGYAVSNDGMDISARYDDPVYKPRMDFEKKSKPGNSGCEDPRLTQIGDTIYMCYTAFNANDPWRVALTSISESDFLSQNWNWKEPILISPPGIQDKNAAIFPEKVNNSFVFFHRIDPCIWIDYVPDLEFEKNNRVISGQIFLEPRTDKWDSEKVGISAPPVKTDKGWLLVYHGVSKKDKNYRLGAMLLHPDHPNHILARLDEPILEPEADYEMRGVRDGTVFSNGMVTIGNELFVYYGGADQVLGVASCEIDKLLFELTK